VFLLPIPQISILSYLLELWYQISELNDERVISLDNKSHLCYNSSYTMELMMIDTEQIYSQCVYDVDNRYVNLRLKSYGVSQGGSFSLLMTDTSNDPKLDQEISIFLTPDDLREVIVSLTEALEKNERRN
jgi:hypothetical protein